MQFTLADRSHAACHNVPPHSTMARGQATIDALDLRHEIHELLNEYIYIY